MRKLLVKELVKPVLRGSAGALTAYLLAQGVPADIAEALVAAIVALSGAAWDFGWFQWDRRKAPTIRGLG